MNGKIARVLLLFALATGSQLFAQWHSVLPEKAGRIGLTPVNYSGTRYYWVEKTAIYSSGMASVETGLKTIYQAEFSFADAENGLMLCYGTNAASKSGWFLFYTGDTGKQWQQANGLPDENPYGVSGGWYGTESILCKGKASWYFNSSQGSWKSEDAGKSWNRASLGKNDSNYILWSQGNEFVITKPRTEQSTWRMEITNTDGNLSVFFKDDSAYLEDDTMQWRYQDDSGKWITAVYRSGWYEKGIIHRTPCNHWYMLFNHYIPGCGASYDYSVLLRTFDRGKHWQKVKIDLGINTYTPPTSMQFNCNDIGFLAINDQVFRSLDGGAHWKPFTVSVRKNASDYAQIAGLEWRGDSLIVITSSGSVLSHSALAEDVELHISSGSDPITVSLFPNPAKSGGDIHVVNSSQTGNNAVEFQLMQMDGKQLGKGWVSDGLIHLPALAQGIYFLHLVENGKTLTSIKLVLE